MIRLKVDREVIRCEMSDDQHYRYLLEVNLGLKQPGKRLVVIQKNPSIADGVLTDPTVSRVENWARVKGFTEVCYLNLFARRSTKPTELNKYDYSVMVGKLNDEIILQQLNTSQATVFAWGNPSSIKNQYYKRRSREVHSLVASALNKIHIVGALTKEGYPRHGLLWRDSWEITVVNNSHKFSYLKR